MNIQILEMIYNIYDEIRYTTELEKRRKPDKKYQYNISEGRSIPVNDIEFQVFFLDQLFPKWEIFFSLVSLNIDYKKLKILNRNSRFLLEILVFFNKLDLE